MAIAIVSKPAVEQLKTSLSRSSAVVTPDSENYGESIKRWADSSEMRAAVVIFPTTAEDVAAALAFAKTHSLEVAVCGGGHSTKGASSTEGGLCIDLSKMRNVVVDPEKMTITAQGGCLWADVDSAAAEHGLATVGGTVNHTGVGGLTLGGGYGWLSGAHGLTIDNLLEVEIVLADGTIAKASEKENPDLFWAVRGAGACFGAVTSFTFRAFEQKNPVFAGLLIFPPNKLAEVVEIANQKVELSGGRHGMVIGFGHPPPAHQPLVLTVVFYNGTEAEGKEFFAPLFALGPIVDQTGVMPYPALNAMLNPLAPPGGRRTQKGSAIIHPLEPAFAQDVFEDYVHHAQTVPDGGRAVILLEFIVPHEILKVAPTATAFANRGAYCNAVAFSTWTDESQDDAHRSWNRSVAGRFDAELERTKKSKSESIDKATMEAVAQYSNYDGFGISAKEMFGINTPRVLSLKKRYDPENVFSKFASLLPAKQ